MSNTLIDETLDATTQDILAERPFLRRVARRLVRHDSDVDDLVQETVVRAYVARDRFKRGTSIRAWLATILRRLFLTDVAKKKRRGTMVDSDVGEPLSTAGGPTAPHKPRRDLDYDQLLQRVDDRVKLAFDRLPETYRKPFVMFALDGWSYAEIAYHLRIPVGTVMSRIHRARQRLKGVIEGSPTAA